MNLTLFRKEIKSNIVLFVIILAVLSLYSIIIVFMADPSLGDSLSIMMESIPDAFAAFGMANVVTTLLEFLVNYLYGFLLIILPFIFMLILSNRLVVHYTDTGAMAYLLAGPHKRKQLILTQAIFYIVSSLLLLVYVTALIAITCQIMFPKELDLPSFLLINVALYGLLLFMGGICFLTSCLCNESRISISISAGINIFFLLIQMLSDVNDKLSKLKYLTPMTLFDPSGLIEGTISSIAGFIILYIAGILLIVIGVSNFCKRDIPV